MTDDERDPGLAFERTTLAWNRTGLASVGAGAICLKVFWTEGVLGVALALLLIAIGVLAYEAGAHAPAGRRVLRAMSLAVTATAVIGVALSVVG
jgi:uncharacterized membrane protein YidH (DUF202 family)